MSKKDCYQMVLKQFKEEHNLNEEEFLRLYDLHENDGEGYLREFNKLPLNTQYAFPHLYVAYRQLLREQKKI